jgi:hypothetical protein
LSLLVLATAALGCAPVTLKVLVFNIEYGGALVDFAKTVEVVQRAAPDIVLVEEAWATSRAWREASGGPSTTCGTR